MEQEQFASLALYREGRASEAPTTEWGMSVLEGHRRHRLLDERGEQLKCFHDPLPEVAKEVLELLEVNARPYGEAKPIKVYRAARRSKDRMSDRWTSGG